MVVSVVINFQGLADTTRCVESLLASTYPPHRVVVVDNGSNNTDADIIDSGFGDRIELIRLSQNLGYGGGANVGIRWAIRQHAEYVWVLNNDTIVRADAIDKLVHAMETSRWLGVTSPEIEAPIGPESPTGVWYAGGSVSLSRAETRHVRLTLDRAPTVVATEFVTGCAMFLRCEALEAADVFWERLFLYWEDADLSLRLLNAGWGLGVVPQATITHFAHGSMRSHIAERYFFRNAILVARRHGSLWVVTKAFATLAVRLARDWGSALLRRRSMPLAEMRGLFEGTTLALRWTLSWPAELYAGVKPPGVDVGRSDLADVLSPSVQRDSRSFFRSKLLNDHGPHTNGKEHSSNGPISAPNLESGRRLWRQAWASVVARNTVLQLANQAFSIGTGLLTFAMITRALGTDAYGTFGLATTYAAFVAIILDAGLDTHVVKELAATGASSPRSDHARRLVSDAVLLRCALWLIATVSAMTIGAVVGYAPLVMLGVAMLSANALIGAVGMLVTDIYQAAHDVRIAVLASLLSRVIATALLAWLYLAGLLNVESLLVVTLFGGISGLGAVLAIAIHQGFSFKRPSAGRGWQLYRAAASLAVWVVLGQVVHRADVIVMSIVPLDPSLELSNQHAVGIYVAAYRFFDLTLGLPGFIVISLMPRLAYFAATDPRAYWTYLRRWIGRMGAIGVSVGALLAVAGNPAMLVIAGPSFARSGALVAILAGAVPFAFLTSLLFAASVAIGARRRVVVLYFIVASLNVGANVLLIPNWGYWAAAYLTTLCQVILALGMALILWKEMERRS